MDYASRLESFNSALSGAKEHTDAIEDLLTRAKDPEVNPAALTEQAVSTISGAIGGAASGFVGIQHFSKFKQFGNDILKAIKGNKPDGQQATTQTGTEPQGGADAPTGGDAPAPQGVDAQTRPQGLDEEDLDEDAPEDVDIPAPAQAQAQPPHNIGDDGGNNPQARGLDDIGDEPDAENIEDTIRRIDPNADLSDLQRPQVQVQGDRGSGDIADFGGENDADFWNMTQQEDGTFVNPATGEFGGNAVPSIVDRPTVSYNPSSQTTTYAQDPETGEWLQQVDNGRPPNGGQAPPDSDVANQQQQVANANDDAAERLPQNDAHVDANQGAQQPQGGDAGAPEQPAGANPQGNPAQAVAENPAPEDIAGAVGEGTEGAEGLLAGLGAVGEGASAVLGVASAAMPWVGAVAGVVALGSEIASLFTPKKKAPPPPPKVVQNTTASIGANLSSDHIGSLGGMGLY